MLNEHNILMHLGYCYLDAYAKGIFELDMIYNLPSIRHCLLSIYGSMVGRKIITSIENLPPEIKVDLKSQCRPYTDGKGKELAIEFVKCYWALDQLAKIKEGL